MKNKIIVEKILKYIQKLLSYVKGIDYDSFVENTMLVEACVFNLSQMGELANRIDEEFAVAHPEVPWRHIYGLRNRIVHDYEGVNLQLIWEIIADDLESLKESLTNIL